MEMYDAVSHGVGRALLQSSSKSTSTRVLGVGPGVFILGFFAILSGVIIVVSRGSKHKKYVFRIASPWLASASEREQRFCKERLVTMSYHC